MSWLPMGKSEVNTEQTRYDPSYTGHMDDQNKEGNPVQSTRRWCMERKYWTKNEMTQI
jgi:hypothetical protein